VRTPALPNVRFIGAEEMIAHDDALPALLSASGYVEPFSQGARRAIEVMREAANGNAERAAPAAPAGAEARPV
jgi:hypothetical protein